MKRRTIIKRTCWNSSRRGGGYTTESYKVLNDLTDKKLQATLEEMNKPFRANFWKIVYDYKLDRVSDKRDYLKYCIDCYFSQYNKDKDSAEVGKRIVSSVFDANER